MQGSAIRGQAVNKVDLARMFGVSVNSVTAWLRRGCPYIQRGGQGKEWQLDTAAVAEWREEQATMAAMGDTSQIDVDEARRRKLAAEAALAEIDLGKARGELVEVDEIASIVGEEYAAVRAKILSLPRKAAPLLEGLTMEERVVELDRELRAVLAELSADSGWDDPEEADTAEEGRESNAAA